MTKSIIPPSLLDRRELLQLFGKSALALVAADSLTGCSMGSLGSSTPPKTSLPSGTRLIVPVGFPIVTPAPKQNYDVYRHVAVEDMKDGTDVYSWRAREQTGESEFLWLLGGRKRGAPANTVIYIYFNPDGTVDQLHHEKTGLGLHFDYSPSGSSYTLTLYQRSNMSYIAQSKYQNNKFTEIPVSKAAFAHIRTRGSAEVPNEGSSPGYDSGGYSGGGSVNYSEYLANMKSDFTNKLDTIQTAMSPVVSGLKSLVSKLIPGGITGALAYEVVASETAVGLMTGLGWSATTIAAAPAVAGAAVFGMVTAVVFYNSPTWNPLEGVIHTMFDDGSGTLHNADDY